MTETLLALGRYEEVVALGFDDGRLKTASFDASEGFGLRAVRGGVPAASVPISTPEPLRNSRRASGRSSLGTSPVPSAQSLSATAASADFELAHNLSPEGEKALQSRIAGLLWSPRLSLGRAFWEARNALPLSIRKAAFDRLSGVFDNAGIEGRNIVAPITKPMTATAAKAQR